MQVIVINSKKYGRHEVFVDDEDYDRVMKYTWNINYNRNTYYAISVQKINGKKIRIHALIMKNDYTKEKCVIDHKDGNGLNNQKNNLRVCKHIHNSYNRRVPKNNTIGGYKGLKYYKRTKKYEARVQAGGKYYYIGMFDNIKEAALAYNKKAIELFGEFAYLNIIEGIGNGT